MLLQVYGLAVDIKLIWTIMIEIRLLLSKISRFLDNFQDFEVGIVQNVLYVNS